MTTLIVLNILFVALIVGGLAAVCRAAYHAASGRFDIWPRPVLRVERYEEEERLAA
jgi:hypothetical protein